MIQPVANQPREKVLGVGAGVGVVLTVEGGDGGGANVGVRIWVDIGMGLKVGWDRFSWRVVAAPCSEPLLLSLLLPGHARFVGAAADNMGGGCIPMLRALRLF